MSSAIMITLRLIASHNETLHFFFKNCTPMRRRSKRQINSPLQQDRDTAAATPAAAAQATAVGPDTEANASRAAAAAAPAATAQAKAVGPDLGGFSKFA